MKKTMKKDLEDILRYILRGIKRLLKPITTEIKQQLDDNKQYKKIYRDELTRARTTHIKRKAKRDAHIKYGGMVPNNDRPNKPLDVNSTKIRSPLMENNFYGETKTNL